MGAARQGRPNQVCGWSLSTTPAALVVPRVPTFSVDKGFWYSIPDHLADVIGVGTQVRVPLSGRRVRGFVVEVHEDREGPLKPVQAVSGEQAIFTPELLSSLRWAANHYIAPLSVVLEKAAPPTLPGPAKAGPINISEQGGGTTGALGSYVAALVKNERRPPLALLTAWNDATWLESIRPLLAAGTTVLTIVSTVREVAAFSQIAHATYGKDLVVTVPDGGGAPVTTAWEAASHGGRLVIGTPRVASWKVDMLAMVVVVEEGRRAMKDRQTPTLHVRDLMRTRARVEGFGLVFVGPTPSVELVAAGSEMLMPRRPWGLVEVVDRRQDPPGGGYISERSASGIRAMAKSGGRVFVFTHRRAADASVRCSNCRSLRLCQKCGSQVGNNPACLRCGQTTGKCARCSGNRFESMGTVPSRIIGDVARRIGGEMVGDPESGRQVIVGTERDLAGLTDIDLAVAVDVDALIFGQNYRSSEEALRILARLVGSVRRGHGSRTVLQTSNPESSLLAALRRGDPIPYLESILVERARNGFPPSTEMMAIEVRDDGLKMASKLLEELAGSMILGRVETDRGLRWLLQGDLGVIKPALRKVAQKLRDAGATVRIDVDPIDL